MGMRRLGRACGDCGCEPAGVPGGPPGSPPTPVAGCHGTDACAGCSPGPGDTLQATFADTGVCSCLDANVATLTYDHNLCYWTGSTTCDGKCVFIRLWCTSAVYSLVLEFYSGAACTGSFICSVGKNHNTITCSPFQATFDNLLSACCSGTGPPDRLDVVVTL